MRRAAPATSKRDPLPHQRPERLEAGVLYVKEGWGMERRLRLGERLLFFIFFTTLKIYIEQ